jgi:phage shock protein A
MESGLESDAVIELLKVLVRPDDTPEKARANVNLAFEYLKAIEEIEKEREAVRKEERKRLSRIDDLKQNVQSLRYGIREDEGRMKNLIPKIEAAKVAEKAAKKGHGKDTTTKLPSPTCKGCSALRDGRERGSYFESVDELAKKAASLQETMANRKQNLAKAIAELEKLGEKVDEEKRQDDLFNG